MKQSLVKKHHNCELVINWARTNNFSPALVCANHRDKKGRHQYIDWISDNNIMPLIDMGVRQIYDESED